MPAAHAHPLEDAVRQGLRTLGWYRRDLPASYLDGADTPTAIPVSAVPSPVGPLSAASLDAATQEALQPRHVATPDGHEPGLLEDLGQLPLTKDNVEAILDDHVRPALNADGGDITLVDIRDQDVYVRLVGACNTCPSSVMTMRMGVERLLQDEFPDMRDLVQVDGGML